MTSNAVWRLLGPNPKGRGQKGSGLVVTEGNPFGTPRLSTLSTQRSERRVLNPADLRRSDQMSVNRP